MKVENVVIIGVGLIGGSLGMALKKYANRKGIRYHITGIGRDEKKLRLAKSLGALDEYTTKWEDTLRKADIVVISTPVDVIPKIVRFILPFLKPGCIITDVGSSKNLVMKGVNKVLNTYKREGKTPPYFVGCHPLAGNEKSGVRYASSELYKGATVAITYENDISNYAIRKISRLWKLTGANILFITPKLHDKIVSATSHLPHILAFTLNNLVYNLWKKENNVKKLIAGSFKDMTRISDSNPKDWATICVSNRYEIKKILKRYLKILKDVEESLDSEYKIENIFKKGFKFRQILKDKSI